MRIIDAAAKINPRILIRESCSLNKIIPVSVATATVPRLLTGNTTELPHETFANALSMNRNEK